MEKDYFDTGYCTIFISITVKKPELSELFYSQEMDFYILRNSEPVKSSLADWVQWRTENRDRMHISETNVGHISILTLFWGFEEKNTGTAPLLFETLTFDGDAVRGVQKYSSFKEALEGHKQICESIFSELFDPGSIKAGAHKVIQS
jgi:hypothetical protein